MFSQVHRSTLTSISQLANESSSGTALALWRSGSDVFDRWKILVGPQTMLRQMRKANLQTSRRGGFSAIELLVTATVLSIVSAFGLMGITKARAAVRLSGSAREYASYIEKARIASIRSHADDAAERASVEINDDRTSYDVTMDLDGDGGMDTRTITLPSGITFETVESIA